MEEVTKQTITTQRDGSTVVEVSPEERNATTLQTAEYIIYFLFGALEILLAFRFVLKLTGAGPGGDFVNFIYSLSNIFIVPFQGIFPTGTAQGAETTAFFEPATIVAVLVYAVVAWGLVQLVKLISGKKQAD